MVSCFRSVSESLISTRIEPHLAQANIFVTCSLVTHESRNTTVRSRSTFSGRAPVRRRRRRANLRGPRLGQPGRPAGPCGLPPGAALGRRARHLEAGPLRAVAGASGEHHPGPFRTRRRLAGVDRAGSADRHDYASGTNDFRDLRESGRVRAGAHSRADHGRPSFDQGPWKE